MRTRWMVRPTTFFQIVATHITEYGNACLVDSKRAKSVAFVQKPLHQSNVLDNMKALSVSSNSLERESKKIKNK